MRQSQVGQVVRTQRQYYDAMARNGWLLPRYGAALVNRDFLDGIRLGAYYCPAVKDGIVKLPCPNPPPKAELIALFEAAVAARPVDEDSARLAGLLSLMELGKLPDNDWLLLLLSHVPGRDCSVFQKHYKYVRPPSLLRPELLLFDEDGFFEGLPAVSAHDLRRRNQLRVPKADRLEQQRVYLLAK